MDALSQMLNSLRLERARFAQVELGAPWRLASPGGPHVAGTAWPRPPAHAIVYYHVLAGRCTLKCEGRPPLELGAGDVALVPHGSAHSLLSSRDAETRNPLPLSTVMQDPRGVVSGGGGGLPSRVTCGVLACDPALSRQLFALLPRLLAVNMREDDKVAWLQRYIAGSLQPHPGEAAAEMTGEHGMLTKVAEVLLVEVLRRYLTTCVPAGNEWLAGLCDRVVSGSLLVMFERPAQRWTLESLAREVNTSRSVLAERFQKVVGTSPMSYLGRWRMTLAANMLRDTELPLSRIAEEVGYETDTAFSRAFRREYGLPPAAWRRANAASGPDGGAAPHAGEEQPIFVISEPAALSL